MKPLVKQRALMAAQDLNIFLRNSYTGLSSDFLDLQLKKMRGKFESDADQVASGKTKEKVWAGSLHLLQEKQNKKNKKSDSLLDDDYM